MIVKDSFAKRIVVDLDFSQDVRSMILVSFESTRVFECQLYVTKLNSIGPERQVFAVEGSCTAWRPVSRGSSIWNVLRLYRVQNIAVEAMVVVWQPFCELVHRIMSILGSECSQLAIALTTQRHIPHSLASLREQDLCSQRKFVEKQAQNVKWEI